jgi:hypothetical protein
MAMGAVLGITAFGRTQEKIAGAANAPAPVVSAIAAPTTTIVAATVDSQPQVTTGFSGKLAPPAAAQPQI